MSRVTFTFNGETHVVDEGLTIAAALISVQKNAWRETRKNQESRGVFCGIGACFDCLVTVNEQANVRACLETIREGDSIVTGGQHAH